MKYRQLPRTSLLLSEVGFGLWTVATTWWGRIEESEKVRLLERAVELGVNFFDTADTYGEGYGEEVLAKALRHERHNIVIATKFGYDFYDTIERIGHQERPQRFEPEFIRYACEQSLRRLKTDYIDLYQLHNPRIDAIERDEVFDLLGKMVKEGKIRHYGAALGPDIGWFEEGEASMRERKVSSLQIIYSILEQEPARRFFPIAEQERVGLLSRVPHASEVLTGRYTEPPAFDPSDHRAHRKHEWMVQALKKVEQVKFLAQEGRALSQAAIKFALAQDTIVSVLPNITSMEELHEYASAPDTPDLDGEEMERLDDLWEHGFYLEEVPAASRDQS
jgi:aryl-alcohol dehydrogenase-like predicted oxidoreductase